jgi:hypothetical protein
LSSKGKLSYIFSEFSLLGKHNLFELKICYTKTEKFPVDPIEFISVRASGLHVGLGCFSFDVTWVSMTDQS